MSELKLAHTYRESAYPQKHVRHFNDPLQTPSVSLLA